VFSKVKTMIKVLLKEIKNQNLIESGLFFFKEKPHLKVKVKNFDTKILKSYEKKCTRESLSIQFFGLSRRFSRSTTTCPPPNPFTDFINSEDHIHEMKKHISYFICLSKVKGTRLYNNGFLSLKTRMKIK
jgi:hypothetical protein